VTDGDYPGPIENYADAEGEDVNGVVVTDSAYCSVNVVGTPSIEIEKKVLDNGGHWRDSVTTLTENNVLFKIKVSNTGNIPLNNIEIVDNLPSFLSYNYDANPSPYFESDHQIKWNFGNLPVNEYIELTFSAYVDTEGIDNNFASATGTSLCGDVNDEDTVSITAYPCAPEVWVDDDYTAGSDNDGHIWGYDAFDKIQDAIDNVCACGTIFVMEGIYIEQLIINKDLHLLGEEGAKIILPNIVNSYTIEGSTDSWVPIIFAYGGNLIGNDVNGPEIISVRIDGFEINGGNKTNPSCNEVDIMFRNVREGCVTNAITHNDIHSSTYGIGLWNSSEILLGYNLIQYHEYGIQIDGDSYDIDVQDNYILDNHIGLLLTVNNGYEPNDILVHYNYFDTFCSMDIGIWNQGDITTPATFNWWGAPDGPSSPGNADTYDAITGRIADGFGEEVIGLVNFDPWWGIEANGTVIPLSASTGEFIFFDGSDSFAYDITGDITGDLVYLWDLDNGYYSQYQAFGYVYSTPGTYNVKLRIRHIDYAFEGIPEFNVYDYGFFYDWAYFTVTVSDPGMPLTANANAGNFGDYEGRVNEPIQFFGAATGGTPPYSFSWDFDDGSYSEVMNPTHIFENEGAYTVTLTVTDNEGNTDSDTAQVIVHGADNLIADAGGPYTGYTGEDITFKGSVTGGLEPYIFIWNFGDGSNPIQIQNPTYKYNEANTYNVKLTVIDSEGNSDDNEVEAIIIEDEENKVEVKDIKGGLGVKATLITGSNPISWSIDIDGRFVFGGKSSSGIVHADSTEVIRTPLLIGLGNINIIIKADTVTEERNAFMIGPFVFLEKNQI
jgi:uncharacterized repeat protein (TIGR01451 family)